MKQDTANAGHSHTDLPEPRWPALIAVLAAGGLYAALPASLAIGPHWLQLAIICVLVVPAVISHRSGNHAINKVFGHLLAGIITFFMVWSLVLLVLALPAHKEPPIILLRSAAALWVSNVLAFALWYWRLDGGGPHDRFTSSGKASSAFLFPQMMFPGKSKHGESDAPNWSPDFIDYLFLSFNTSTAFSPTDTPVLSRWAKVLTMTQSGISLTVVVILAARAVNIL